MMNDIQLALNRELLKVDIIRLQIEILVEGGMSLSSPRLIELNNEIDKCSLRATKIQEGLRKNQEKRLIFKLTV
ncbi:MAG: hypothetical protein GX323_10160 [Clostridiales bacterium]|nr:hypothetical protein [Clostridiales bacterium]